MGVNVGLVARGGGVGGEVMVILGGKGGLYCSYWVWGGGREREGGGGGEEEGGGEGKGGGRGRWRGRVER